MTTFRKEKQITPAIGARIVGKEKATPCEVAISVTYYQITTN